MTLTTEELQNEIAYHRVMKIVKRMLADGIVTGEEYSVLCGRLETAFPTVIGGLFAPQYWQNGGEQECRQ